MDETKTPHVSPRLPRADLDTVAAIARRLRVRESDIIRFALRLAFARLVLLLDESARGRDLIPVFLECGPELTHHFDLDVRTLEAIINGSVDDPQKQVDREDIELISVLPELGCAPSAEWDDALEQIECSNFPDALKLQLYQQFAAPRNRFAGLDRKLSSLRQAPCAGW